MLDTDPDDGLIDLYCGTFDGFRRLEESGQRVMVYPDLRNKKTRIEGAVTVDDHDNPSQVVGVGSGPDGGPLHVGGSPLGIRGKAMVRDGNGLQDVRTGGLFTRLEGSNESVEDARGCVGLEGRDRGGNADQSSEYLYLSPDHRIEFFGRDVTDNVMSGGGAQGPEGPRGPQGPQGPPGSGSADTAALEQRMDAAEARMQTQAERITALNKDLRKLTKECRR